MARTIVKSGNNLSNYPIRKLVKQADELGSYLKQQGLKTNQIRKFLDTVNRLKIQVKLALQGNFKTSNSRENIEDEESEIIFLKDFPKIDTELVLLKQKLVYAAARQSAVNPLKEVIDMKKTWIFTKAIL
ncbi:MAG: type III-A CRISPR-associated protein Csm2 [Flavobacterium sp.]|nr:MAG: type III-A CRISPR-associated protein Csm2 [Flavobacterium sp.]